MHLNEEGLITLESLLSPVAGADINRALKRKTKQQTKAYIGKRRGAPKGVKQSPELVQRRTEALKAYYARRQAA